MVGLQTLDLAIGVRVPASQPIKSNESREALSFEPPVLCAYSVPGFELSRTDDSYRQLAKQNQHYSHCYFFSITNFIPNLRPTPL